MARRPSRIAVKFSEAIEALRRRLAVSSGEWETMVDAEEIESDRAVEDLVRAVMRDLMEAALKVLEDGGTLETFRADYDRIVTDRGWSYHGNSGWHSRLIFRLHTGRALGAGRLDQARRLQAANPDRVVIVRYVTAGDHRVRDEHAEWHGVTLPLDDPWWVTHWPPNGFNCRCHVAVSLERPM